MLSPTDKQIITELERLAARLRPGYVYAYPHAINYAVLNNLKSRIAYHNANSKYDSAVAQCDVKVTQEHIGQHYFVTIRKVVR